MEPGVAGVKLYPIVIGTEFSMIGTYTLSNGLIGTTFIFDWTPLDFQEIELLNLGYTLTPYPKMIGTAEIVIGTGSTLIGLIGTTFIFDWTPPVFPEIGLKVWGTT